MYSDEELDLAVSAGVLSAETAASFRAFAAQNRAAPAVDEEHFRLLTGFNDIFVSIAAALILGAVGWLAGMIFAPLGGAAVAAASWGLAEYFTRRRRMALPSLLLLLGFVGGVFATSLTWIGKGGVVPDKFGEAGGLALSAALAAIAAYLHWRRFKVPITVAAGVVAAVATALSLLLGFIPAAQNLLSPLLLAGGLAVFALALRWDMSDRNRTTRRADVAFWLHLSAAPLIVHPAFALLGLLPGGIFQPEEAGLGRAAAVIAIYVGLALVALAIDRRALLVSGLSYVLYAMSALFRAAGSLSASLALTALVIGSALLLLSAYWHPARKLVLARLPETVRAKLPVA
jgi:hypothetical protein